MIIYRLQRRKAEEEHGPPCAHPRKLIAQSRADGIHKETLEGVVVERAESVRNVQAVVAGVKCFYSRQR